MVFVVAIVHGRSDVMKMLRKRKRR
jgi:hypothetical protein